jgi:hypothetical protein
MLRESSDATNLGIDISNVFRTPPAELPASAELAALTDALTIHPTVDPVGQRAALVAAAGPETAERAVAVCATFNMMNRLLDGVGAPIPTSLDPLALELGLDLTDVHH